MKFVSNEPLITAAAARLRGRLEPVFRDALPLWKVRNIDLNVVELFDQDTQEMTVRITLQQRRVDAMEELRPALPSPPPPAIIGAPPVRFQEPQRLVDVGVVPARELDL